MGLARGKGGGKEGAIIGNAGIAAALLLVVSLTYLTVRQIALWRDSFSLWTSCDRERG